MTTQLKGNLKDIIDKTNRTVIVNPSIYEELDKIDRFQGKLCSGIDAYLESEQMIANQ